ncbi:MAG: hypothetical protein MUC88_06310 [Planctomycetes bacterium]|nr:hypothetical protein [Planctomycetota bacterium]
MLFESVQKETIYIAVLDEGTLVWRPVSALRVGPRTYVVLLKPSFEYEGEEWEFPPGSVVVCEKQKRSRGEVMTAVSHAEV